MNFKFATILMVGVTLFADGRDISWPKLDANVQAIYDSIWEPRVVAVPPSDAGPGCIFATPNGTLRTMGSNKYGDRVRRVVMDSNDLGLNWSTRLYTDEDGAMQECPWADYRISTGGPASNRADFGWCWKHERMKDGSLKRSRTPVPGLVSYGRLRPIVSRKRWLYTFSTVKKNEIGYVPRYIYSDDDGANWSDAFSILDTASCHEITPPDKMLRWDVGCNESDMVELGDGSVLLVARTGTDHPSWYRSEDGGKTWGRRFELPAFWMSNTMPLLKKLKDGRIIFFWNNTQVLPKEAATTYPELSETETNGRWQSVFTNRDALHAAITEDDGKTWIGFREIALNDVRNREDYREAGNEHWQMAGGSGIDKSVHQADAVELPGGKIAIMYGQSRCSRRIALFDVRWLYEKGREEDLRRGTEHLSNHLFVRSLMGGYRGWSGHASLNRVAGAAMVREPDTDRKTRRECLQICRIRDERLVDDHQGVVWNFPAARRGKVEFECRIDGAGVRVSLCDHWVNPSDWAIAERAMFSETLDDEMLGGNGRWAKATFMWNLEKGEVTFVCGAAMRTYPLKTNRFSPYGISYLHLQTTANGHDPKGTYFRWFKMAETNEEK